MAAHRPAPVTMTMVSLPSAQQPVTMMPTIMAPVMPPAIPPPTPEMPGVTPPAMMAPPEITPEIVPVPMAEAPPMPQPMRMAMPIPTEGAALRARFGEPNFIRREGDSELWRYDSVRCSVFFFLSRTGNELHVRFTDTLPRTMMGPDPACIDALQQRAEQMASGAMQSPAVMP